jgi:PAS domain-containing protein
LKPFENSKHWLWSPGIFNLPRVLSLITLIVSLFSLLLNWAVPVTYRPDVPSIFRIAPQTALAFLLLAFSMRLAKWERIDSRKARRAKVLRVMAGISAILSLLSVGVPVLLSAGLCILSATVILQAHGRYLFARRVLLVVSLINGTWLVLANLYAVHGRISYELTADPTSALLFLAISMSLSLSETRNGLVPLALTAVLGARSSVHLLLAALLVPVLLGYVKMQLENLLQMDSHLMLAAHVMGTLFVMALLLFWSMTQAKEALDEQRRVQADLESTESALQSLLEQGSEFYLTVSLASRVLTANENARRYLGLPDLSRNVVSIEDLILSESHDKMKRLPEALLRGTSDHAVLLFRLADGEAMPLHITAACRMRHGTAVEIVLVGRSLPLGLRSKNSSQALLVNA